MLCSSAERISGSTSDGVEASAASIGGDVAGVGVVGVDVVAGARDSRRDAVADRVELLEQRLGDVRRQLLALRLVVSPPQPVTASTAVAASRQSRWRRRDVTGR